MKFLPLIVLLLAGCAHKTDTAFAQAIADADSSLWFL